MVTGLIRRGYCLGVCILLVSSLSCKESDSSITPSAASICKQTSNIFYIDGVQRYKTLTSYDEHFQVIKTEKYSGTDGPYITDYQNTYDGDLLIKSFPLVNNTSYRQTEYAYHPNKKIKSEITAYDYSSNNKYLQILEYDDKGNKTRVLYESSDPSDGYWSQETITTYNADNAIVKEKGRQNNDGDILSWEILNEYNAKSQLITSITIVANTVESVQLITRYTYFNDKLSEETSYQNGKETNKNTYEYKGNVLSRIIYGATSDYQLIRNFNYNQQGKQSVVTTENNHNMTMEVVENSYYPNGIVQLVNNYYMTDKNNSATKRLMSTSRYDDKGNELESIQYGGNIYSGGSNTATQVSSIRTVSEYICR